MSSGGVSQGGSSELPLTSLSLGLSPAGPGSRGQPPAPLLPLLWVPAETSNKRVNCLRPPFVSGALWVSLNSKVFVHMGYECLYVCVCAGAHICVHVRIVYARTYMCTHKHMLINMYTHARECSCRCVCICLCTDERATYVCMDSVSMEERTLCVCVCVCVRCVCVHMHVCVCAHTGCGETCLKRF